MVVRAANIDSDRDLDLVVSPLVVVLRNRGDGTFDDEEDVAGITGRPTTSWWSISTKMVTWTWP
jgi:hypothetical protein